MCRCGIHVCSTIFFYSSLDEEVESPIGKNVLPEMIHKLRNKNTPENVFNWRPKKRTPIRHLFLRSGPRNGPLEIPLTSNNCCHGHFHNKNGKTMSDFVTLIPTPNSIEKQKQYEWDAAISYGSGGTLQTKIYPLFHVWIKVYRITSKLHQLISKYTKYIELYCTMHVFQQKWTRCQGVKLAHHTGGESCPPHKVHLVHTTPQVHKQYKI